MQKVTPERARVHNSQLVFRTIYRDGPISRAEIARTTLLTRPTVSDVVSDLIEEGMVEEVGLAPSSGGRRAILLRVVDDSRYLVGVDLAREEFCGALINLRGEIKHRITLPLDGRDGDAALALVFDLIDRLFESTSVPLLGIGVGTPGLVDAVNGVLQQSVNLSWRHIPMRSLLQERYDLPVYLANDCQVAALAEYTFGDDRDRNKNLVVVNVRWGIGAGIVVNGQLLHGNPVGAGEIGHVTVVEDGELCACGNYGCLETITSTRAIIRRAQAIARDDPHSPLHQFASSPETITMDAVCQAFNAGNEAVREVVHEAGRMLGISTASLVGVLGKCRLLIAGNVRCFGQFLLDAVRDEMMQRSLLSVARDIEVGFTSLGSDIVLLGASALVLPHELGDSQL
jgi:predicted NBD/HSP70 family sugar kinase